MISGGSSARAARQISIPRSLGPANRFRPGPGRRARETAAVADEAERAQTQIPAHQDTPNSPPRRCNANQTHPLAPPASRSAVPATVAATQARPPCSARIASSIATRLSRQSLSLRLSSMTSRGVTSAAHSVGATESSDSVVIAGDSARGVAEQGPREGPREAGWRWRACDDGGACERRRWHELEKPHSIR